ncbi:MAG: hypothetical protein J6S58_10960, partial [Lentisphaeria bacterium]|nr:hypothetical protein [Lentisphaeria bacterium]
MKIILPLLLLIPLLGGTLIYFLKGKSKTSTLLLSLFALIHLGLSLTGALLLQKEYSLVAGWLYLDENGAIFLLIASALFTLCSLHTVSFLTAEEKSLEKAHPDSILMKGHTFCALQLGFLCSMTLVTLAGNFGLLWVA